MTTRDPRHLADDKFAAFLQGEDILARDLQALSHPEPSTVMSAPILMQVTSDLADSAQSLPETSSTPPTVPACRVHRHRLLK